MALVDSLLSAIVRADGDALVMHVGERPYVVVGTLTINISTHGLNLDVMTSMLAQMLPAEAQTQLEEFGAVEYRIPHQGDDRFSIVAARGGDDIWIEIRRRRPQPAAAASAATDQAPAAIAEPAPQQSEAPVEAAPQVAAESAPAQISEPTIAPIPEPIHEPIPEAVAETAPEPAAEAVPQPIVAVAAEPIADAAPEFSPVQPAPIADKPAALGVAWPIDPHAVEQVAEIAPQVAARADEAEAVAALEHTLEPQPATVAAMESPASTEAVAQPELVEAPEPLEPVAVSEIPQPIAEAPAAPAVEEPMVAAVAEPFVEEPIAQPTVRTVEAPAPIAASIETLREAQPPEPAVVLPLTRTVRIEVPQHAQAATRTTTGIDRLLRIAAARGASSLFLTSESRPWIRVEGDLGHLDSEPPLSRADVERAILEIVPESAQEKIGRGEATEWIAEFDGVGRIRCTTFVDHRGPGVLLRMIATRAANADQLGLSRDIQAFATEPQGIVLVAGPRASGKSTLISALVDVVNRQRAEHVITLERQVRLLHDNKSALVSQREIHGGADDAVIAARAALRESPDVLVVDDLMSPQMVPLILKAASDGLLIFVAITAPSTSDAVQRFVELAPPEMRKAVQSSMAEHFRGAVAQVLLKKAGGGLVAAREVLLATGPVTRVISEGQLSQLPIALDEGRKHGMVSFTHTLVDYVRTGAVDVREAFRKSPDRDRLLESLKRGGIDVSAVERLA